MKAFLSTPAFTQIRSQSMPDGQLPSALSLEKLLEFFRSVPSVLTADERYHTTSKCTRKPGQFDKHLHDRLRLKRVAKLPALLRDLLDNAVHALSSYEGDLPAPNALFAFTKDVARTSRSHRRDVHKEVDVQLAYGSGVAELCATVAATLEFQLSHWSPNSLQWSTERLNKEAIPGVRRDQALADGFLNMCNKGSEEHLAHPTPRERLILNTFPVIAIWEFKNLNFDTSEGQVDLEARARVFHEMANGFLDSVFPWEGCEKGDCAVVHWKIGASACPMGNNAVYSSCRSYDSARQIGLPLPEGPPTGYESGAKHSARDILQQAWTEALVHDCTFLVINAGNVEIIGMRDRLTQTLYLSDVFLVNDTVYPYFQLHTGLYVSAIRDAQDRAESIVLRKEIPDTWYLRSGPDSDKVTNLSQPEYKIKKNVSAKLLLEAGRRPWLVILPAEREPLRMIFTMNRYQRIKELPIGFRILHGSRTSQDSDGDEKTSSWQESHDLYWATTNSPSPGTEAWYSSQSISSQASSDSTPFENHGIRSDGPDISTFFEVHAQESFHGLRICRAKLEIPGINYPKNFKEADKPWIILKNAFTAKDIFLMENESKFYDAMKEAHVESIPTKFGFFLSIDPTNRDANFAALLLENKGYSLAQMKAFSPSMKFRVTRREKRLALKSVKSISSFLSDLALSADIALQKSSEAGVGLPSVEWCFPEPQRFTRFINRSPAKDANDIGEVYRASISPVVCELASMLSLHPSAVQWSTAIHMTVRIVSRHQKYHAMIEDYVPEILESYEPIPGKEYAMVDKEAWSVLSDDDRRLLEEMRKRFTRMAVWQTFFSCREAEDALKNLDRLLFTEKFPEFTPMTLVKQWSPIDIPLAASPDAINTAWGTSLSSWIPISVLETYAVLAPSVGRTRPLRRSTRLFPRAKLEQSSKKTIREPKQMSSFSSTGLKHWPSVTLSARKRDLTAVDEDMATSIIQHVMLDIYFIYESTNRFQTLILSDLIDCTHCKDPAYTHIHLGLFISMIDDIRDRTRQLIAQEAKSKPGKRKGLVLLSEDSKRPRTRQSVAREEAQKSDYEQGLKAVCAGIVDRDLALLRIQHGPYNSSAPSSLLRVHDSRSIAPRKEYQPHEYFRVTVTSELARGSTGDAHAATIDFLKTNGETVSFPNIVVKFAFAAVQKKRLRHEFKVYSRLMSAKARGIPHAFGLFEDIETETLVLVMEHAGLTLWDCRLPNKSQRLQFVISEYEK
ncbi:hypothetical protein C0992_013063 [Termitomyces sp. T32_za158]|nr:hypothetical protein C0992_013063 [Termitomyces sp. T32_za158]